MLCNVNFAAVVSSGQILNQFAPPIHHLILCTVPEGSVRLADGTSPQEGRVEVYHNGEWGTVCDDGWDIVDADVVCRQLGFDFATAANGFATYGVGTGPIHYDQVDCAGNETRLAECPFNGLGIHDCSHFEDAGAVCGSESSAQLLFCSYCMCNKCFNRKVENHY